MRLAPSSSAASTLATILTSLALSTAVPACSDDAGGTDTAAEMGGGDTNVGGPGCDEDERVQLEEGLPDTISNNGDSITGIDLDPLVQGKTFVDVGDYTGQGNPDMVITATSDWAGDTPCDDSEVDGVDEVFRAKIKAVEGQTIALSLLEYRTLCIGLTGGKDGLSAEVNEVYTCDDGDGDIDTDTETGGSDTETG